VVAKCLCEDALEREHLSNSEGDKLNHPGSNERVVEWRHFTTRRADGQEKDSRLLFLLVHLTAGPGRSPCDPSRCERFSQLERCFFVSLLFQGRDTW
jgi:hypothetical protein